MKIGTTLPQFQADPDVMVNAAGRAEAAGLDGVFVFDHLWPIGRPDGEVLHGPTLLAAIAATTARIRVGTLVMRAGLLPDAVVAHVLTTLGRLAGSRLVAGVGAGDRLSAAENLAFGVPYPTADVRLASVAAICDRTRADGIETWVGGRSARSRSVAAEHADALNVWGATLEEAAAECADVRAKAGERPIGFTWGGQVLVGRDAAELTRLQHEYGDRPGLVQGTVDEVAAHLRLIEAVGATWAVCAPLDVGRPEAMQNLAEVRAALS